MINQPVSQTIKRDMSTEEAIATYPLMVGGVAGVFAGCKISDYTLSTCFKCFCPPRAILPGDPVYSPIFNHWGALCCKCVGITTGTTLAAAFAGALVGLAGAGIYVGIKNGCSNQKETEKEDCGPLSPHPDTIIDNMADSNSIELDSIASASKLSDEPCVLTHQPTSNHFAKITGSKSSVSSSKPESTYPSDSETPDDKNHSAHDKCYSDDFRRPSTAPPSYSEIVGPPPAYDKDQYNPSGS